MTSAPTPDSLPLPQPGRPIELVPTPRGTWLLLLGGGLALLGPLFGFLIGSAMGAGEGGSDLSPIQLSLFLGVIAGGLGILMAMLGGRRLYLDRRAAAESTD